MTRRQSEPDWLHDLLRDAVLYVLAAPIYALRFGILAIRAIRVAAVLRSGEIVCPHCREKNDLEILAHCRRCGTTEFGSRLYCSACRSLVPGFACDACGVTIKVF